MLACDHRCTTEPDPTAALFGAAEENYDVFIISLALSNFDALRLCSQLRSLERTRSIPILAISSLDDNTRLLRGLEIGVNDYLAPPVDKNELLARVRTQVRKRRYIEKLRDDVQKSLELAITDALTGLHNRRYMERHIGGLVEQACSVGKPLAVLMLDVDHFKAIKIPMDTQRVTRFCGNSRCVSAGPFAASILPAGMAVRNFSSSCRKQIFLQPHWQLNVYVEE
jgi:two-component system cell cycle response regulator